MFFYDFGSINFVDLLIFGGLHMAPIMHGHILIHHYGLKSKWTVDILQSCRLLCLHGIFVMSNYFVKA